MPMLPARWLRFHVPPTLDCAISAIEARSKSATTGVHAGLQHQCRFTNIPERVPFVGSPLRRALHVGSRCPLHTAPTGSARGRGCDSSSAVVRGNARWTHLPRRSKTLLDRAQIVHAPTALHKCSASLLCQFSSRCGPSIAAKSTSVSKIFWAACCDIPGSQYFQQNPMSPNDLMYCSRLVPATNSPRLPVGFCPSHSAVLPLISGLPCCQELANHPG